MNNTEMDEFVSRVRERSDIYAVVSRYLQLNFKGGRYWACCPFHEEKTPSFSVAPDKGLFYCFGCHAGGNVFKFISMIENISYFEAVKLQAERLGMEIPSRQKSPEELNAEREKKSLLQITSLAQEFYHKCLTETAQGEAGRKYLAARGITESVVNNFKLGYAPDAWDALTNALKSHGFSEKQIVSAGLALENKHGTGIYDRLRGRVIIPIADVFGKVVAFGGRILNPETENGAKYLNTPETKIFHKGRQLFGLNKANRAISTKNSAVVVEGYMDAISLASAGIENVVASLGTAFTAEQAKLLTRYARRVIFCYDSDEAGQRATMRALPIINDVGAEVFVVVVPNAKDPDEFVRKYGKDAFLRLLENAPPLIDYKIQYVLVRTDYSTLDGKIKALREILQAVVGSDETVIRNEYSKKISEALYIDESLINEQWRKILERDKNSKPAATKKPLREIDDKIRSILNNADRSTQAGKIRALNEILSTILKIKDKSVQKKYCRRIAEVLELEENFVSEQYRKISAYANPQIRAKENQLIRQAGSTIIREAWYEDEALAFALERAPKEIFTELHQEIISYLEKCQAEERRPDDVSASEELSEEAAAELSRILTGIVFQSQENERKAFDDSLKNLRHAYLKTLYSKLIREAEEYFKSGDEATSQEKTRESLKIKKEMEELQNH